MHTPTAVEQDVLNFWNQRAGLGQWAGTRDVIAKQLEIEVLASQVHDGMRVLEIGCGNGITAIEVAKRFNVKILAFDYAEEMIVEAKRLLEGQELKGSVEFHVGDVRKMEGHDEKFDLIYTERVLINLLEWDLQKQALTYITSLLAPGGLYAMCENSQDGLDNLNVLRARVGLPAVEPPWHNRYLRDREIAEIAIEGVALEGVNDYSSTYYFLSRVINASLAASTGQEPQYDSIVNQLALKLPSFGGVGQGRLWRWRKSDAS